MTAEMKWATVVAVLGLLVASCGGGTVTEESFATVPASSSTSAATETTVATEPPDPPPSTETTVVTEPIVFDGPPAPDFALALDDGRGFILSDESKPVYMVFWAEW